MFGQTELLFKTPPPKYIKEDDQIARLRLLRSPLVSYETYHHLLEQHGTGQDALQALCEVAKISGRTTYQPCAQNIIEEELRRARNTGASLIDVQGLLLKCSLLQDEGAPPFLWSLGRKALLETPLVTLVGAERPSSLGIRMAKRLSQEFQAAGFTILSDLREGIAQVAATSAIEQGVVAVSANGLDIASKHKYLTAHRSLLQNGLLVSDVPMNLPANDQHLKMRDRIMSGLAQAIVVVECSIKSHAFNFTQNALDQGCDVFVVPGHPIDARASGCNMLIRDGATLIRSASDVIEVIGQPLMQEESSFEKQPLQPIHERCYEPEELHKAILEKLSSKPMVEDVLIRDLSATAKAVSPIITELELEGKVARKPGGVLQYIM